MSWGHCLDVVLVQCSRNGVRTDFHRKISLSSMLKSSKGIISARLMDRTHSSKKTLLGLAMVPVLFTVELREFVYLSGTTKANLESP